MDYANDPVIAQFEGHPGRTYEVRQDDRGYYVTRTDATRNFQPEVNHPDSMGGNESFETELVWSSARSTSSHQQGSEFSVDHARVHERDGFFDAAGPIGRYDLAVYALNGYGLEAEAVLANRTDFVSRGSIAGAFQTYFESSTAAAYLEVVFDWMARPPWRPEPDGDAYGSDIARVYCGHGLPTGPCEECDHPAYTAYLDSIEEEGHPR